jgi:hypothetical protein
MIAYVLTALPWVLTFVSLIALSGYIMHWNKKVVTPPTVVGVAKIHEIPRECLLDVLNAIAEVLEAPSVIRTKIAKTKLRILLGEVVPKAFEGIGFWYIKMGGEVYEDGNTPIPCRH